MILKKCVSALTALATAISIVMPFQMVTHADEELSVIVCTQSAAFTDNGANFILNLKDADKNGDICWNNTSGQWKGVGVLEFELPQIDAGKIKSAELTYTVHNGSSRSGGRTYDIYAANIEINSDTTANTLQAIPLTTPIYSGEAVAQNQTRTDTASDSGLRDYIRECASGEKVQFAFSNSSQILDIDPMTASLKIVMYGGGIALDKNEVTLRSGGDPAVLSVNIYEEGISADGFVWSSDNEDAATVKNGIITPHSSGTANITVQTADGSFTDTCIVTVEQAAERIVFDKEETDLYVGGDNGVINARVEPNNAVSRKLEWKSSDDSVATVSADGIVTPIKEGEADVSAYADDGTVYAQCRINVHGAKVMPDSITLSKTDVTMPKLGSTVLLKAAVTPSDADERTTWTSSDESVAKVIDGVIISEKPGRTVITAKTKNGLTAECEVTVTDDKDLITNDVFYTDTEGNILHSQGGGIFKFGDTYYWYGVRYKEGVSYAADPTSGKTVEHPAFEAFTCYTSNDLVNWEYKGDVATLATLGQQWCGWAGRMGVVYHKKTDKYILVSQFNGTIIASADSPLGPFKTVKEYFWGGNKIPGVVNGETGDQTMFQDDDGKAYMICSSSNGRGHLYVLPMRESDFCDFDSENIIEINGSTGQYFDEDGSVKTKDKGGIEGDCMFKYKGRYYFTGSDLYGWHGSRVYVFQSDRIDGDYVIKPDYVTSSERLPYIMKGVKNNYAHNSQTGFYYTLKGSKKETVIYCGDRWADFGAHGIGYNQWVPLSFEGKTGTPIFNDLSQWRLNSETGEWKIAEGNNYLANPAFEADRILVKNITGWESSDNLDGTVNGNIKSRPYSGTYSAVQTADRDNTAVLKQTVKELPDGTYTLRAKAVSSGGQNECVLYALSGNNEYSSSLKSAMNSWTDIVISGIEVKGGECEIGLRSDSEAGKYVRIDDMYFTRDADNTPLEYNDDPDETEDNTKAETVLRITDADGSEIYSIPENGAVCGKARYINNTDKEQKIYIYTAAYNAYGELTEIKMNRVTAAANAKTDISTGGIQADSGVVCIKSLLWDEALAPLCNECVIERK